MELDEIIRTERTIRKFEQKEIPAEVIDRILNNVRMAHCANNRQLLRYVVVQSKEKRDVVGNMVHYAARLPKEIGEPKEDEKAMAYIVITKPAVSNHLVDIDSGIASEVICATAWDEGVGSCIMQNFKASEMDAFLKLPEDRTSRLVISLGYPKITSSVVEMPESGDTAYYLDENFNYYVPKMKAEDISEKI